MEIDWKRAWYFISQLLSILGFAFFGLLVSYFFATLVGKGLYKYDQGQIENMILNPVAENSVSMFLRIFQGLANFGTYGIPVFIYMIVYKFPIFGTLKLKKPFSFFQGLLILVFASAAIFGLYFLSEINQWIPLPESMAESAERMARTQEKMIDSMMFMPSVVHLLANIFVIGFIAAFSEELMFRGLLQPLFKNWTKNIHLGILISAALFSAIHFDPNGFIPRMAIAVAFGYLFYWTGNLWITILAHFLNNSIEIMIYYFKDSNSWLNYILEVKYIPMAWGIAGTLVALGVLFVFKRRAVVQESRTIAK